MTHSRLYFPNIAANFEIALALNNFRILAFTHKSIELDDIGRFHVEDDHLAARLQPLRAMQGVEELMFLSTCNRVEFLLTGDLETSVDFLRKFFATFNPAWSSEEVEWAVVHCRIYEGADAMRHIFYVASSIDSLVVGEREIITQVRTSYEKCQALGLTGDLLRLIIRKTIETAKSVYSDTQIAQKPVSVVSLAFRMLLDLNIKKSARFLVVGAGKTNTLMVGMLRKKGFKNFTIFNRSPEKAKKLAGGEGINAFALAELPQYRGGFDIVLCCTGSGDIIIDKEMYALINMGDTNLKHVIDIALPADFDPTICESFNVNLISLDSLRAMARKNLEERQKELTHCKIIVDRNIDEFRKLIRTRQVELAMREVPDKIKQIRQAAMETVFRKELEALDGNSREVIDKIMNYVEKKYISVPMKMAREIMTEQ